MPHKKSIFKHIFLRDPNVKKTFLKNKKQKIYGRIQQPPRLQLLYAQTKINNAFQSLQREHDSKFNSFSNGLVASPRAHGHRSIRHPPSHHESQESTAGPPAPGLPRPTGDRPELRPPQRHARQHRRAVDQGPGRPVRPGVEAVAVRHADGARDGAGGQQVHLLQRRAGDAAAPVRAADPRGEEHPGRRRRRPQAHPRRAGRVPEAGHAAAVRWKDRRRGAAPHRRELGRPGDRHGDAADEAAHVRHLLVAALRPRARRAARHPGRRLRARLGGRVVRPREPAVHGVQAQPQGQRRGTPAPRRDHAGDEGQAGARRGHAEQRSHRVPAQPYRRSRRAAAERGGDRGQLHGRPRRRPRHVVHPLDVHGPPARQRCGHPRGHGPRARRGRQGQGRRRGPDLGGPGEDEVHVARRTGDPAPGAAHLRQLQDSDPGHRVRRLHHPQGLAGVLDGRRHAHGRRHLPRPGQVRPVQVREPVVGAAVLVRCVRRRPEDLRGHGVRQDRDAGDDASPGAAVPVEALLQGGDLRQGPHAVAAGRPARRD